jgi:hypothetical protein
MTKLPQSSEWQHELWLQKCKLFKQGEAKVPLVSRELTQNGRRSR